MESQLYYKQKANEVKDFVCKNLHQELNTRKLSEQFGISYYHFHRLMKAALKQPLAEYVTNLKFELALGLLRNTDKSISDIALDTGYNDVSAFSKAFTKEFGISPNEYRTDKSLSLNTHVDYRFKQSNHIVEDLKPKYITTKKKQVYFIEVIDRYGGVKTEKAWDILISFAKENRLFGWKPDFFSIYYDEPEEVGEYNCRTDICIASSKIIETSHPICRKLLDGGNFQVYRYKGPWEKLWFVYNQIYDNLLTANGFVLLDNPIMERYLTFAKNKNPDSLLTEIYIPVKLQ